MADEHGSRWYHPVYEGLWDAKHCRQMGPAVWLYGWMLSRAFVARDGGTFVYSHRDAGQELGVSDKSIRLWFERLQQYGYVHTRARHAHHLEVEVTNWRPVEEWLEARTQANKKERLTAPLQTGERSERLTAPLRTGVTTVNNFRCQVENGGEIGKENGKESGKDLPVSHISIRLLGYEYPPASQEGAASAPVCLVGAFRWLWELLRDQKNKSAASAEVYRLTFGEEPPAYGFLGRTAKTVGGWGRMLELFWQVATKPPTGDVLGYVMKMGKGEARGNGKPAAWGNGAAILAANRAALALTPDPSPRGLGEGKEGTE